MGTCCSKIKNLHDDSSFNGALHPSLDEWHASQSYCQLCRANRVACRVACHSQFCVCESCRRSPNRGTKRFVATTTNVSSFREDMCSLCVADVYHAQFHQQAPRFSRQWSEACGDNERSLHFQAMRRDYLTERALYNSSFSDKDAAMQGHCGYGQKVEVSKESNAFDYGCQLLPAQDFGVLDYEHGISQSSASLESGTLVDGSALLSTVAALEIVGSSRRLSNIDDSDGIKLEVRYKHMLPHEAKSRQSFSETNVLKRARPQEDPLLAGGSHSDRSIRHRKSFQRTELDGREESLERSLLMMSSDDDYGDDEGFHDIAVGISIGSYNSERGLCSADTKPHHSLDTCSSSARFQCQQQLHSFMGLEDVQNLNGLLCAIAKENMHSITSNEEERPHCMPLEHMMGSKLQALSIVSTGDAILFSGANSDELHLIPSVAMQKAALSSPDKHLGPGRVVSPERLDALMAEKASLSIEDIIRLLENDELSEYDLLSLLIGSDGKSSPSSSPSPSSSAESTNSWSSLLSSSSLSSSAPSTSSAMTLSPSLLQLPPPSVKYSTTLPYSLSLPSSCKMSPNTSFEFKVKSCESTPSTPVFSPIQSRTKAKMTHQRANSLTVDEIAEIWGVFEQRQAFMSQQHTQN